MNQIPTLLSTANLQVSNPYNRTNSKTGEAKPAERQPHLTAIKNALSGPQLAVILSGSQNEL